MSDQARRKILEQVAAGMMDPGDAADRLAELDAQPPAETTEAPMAVEDRQTPQRTGRVVRVVRVDANFRPVEIVGDAAVKEAVAEGSHRVRWEGDTLVIDGAIALDDEDDDLDFDDRPDFGEWFRTRAPRMQRGIRVYGPGGGHKAHPLRVRMNPDAGLEARVEAGPLKITNVHGPIKVRVAAGPLKIEGFESPIDVRVAAGKVEARGRVDHGASTIDCDAGKVRLHLTHGSHARVSASATLGKVDFGGSEGRHRDYFEEVKAHGLRDLGGLGGIGALGDLSGFGERIATVLNNAFSDEHEVVVGNGTATIDIRVSMGAADITFDDQPS